MDCETFTIVTIDTRDSVTLPMADNKTSRVKPANKDTPVNKDAAAADQSAISTITSTPTPPAFTTSASPEVVAVPVKPPAPPVVPPIAATIIGQSKPKVSVVPNKVAATPKDKGKKAVKTAMPTTTSPSKRDAKRHKSSAGRIGDHSVAISEVIRMNLAEPDPAAPQNICTFMYRQIIANPNTFQVYDDGDIGVHGEFTGPGFQEQTPRYNGRTLYPRFLAIGIAPQPLYIRHGPSIVVDTMTISSAHEFMRGNFPSARALEDALRASISMTLPISQALSSTFLQALARYEMSLLFTIGALIEQMLWDMAQAGVAPVFAAPAANDVQYANIAPAVAEAAPVIATLINGIQNGDIFFDSRKITQQDIQVLRLLCIGTQGIGTAAGEADHVMTYVHTPPLRFIIYGEGNRDIPVIGDVTATSVAATMTILANIMGVPHMMVRGFVRASSIINGVLLAEQQPHQVVINRKPSQIPPKVKDPVPPPRKLRAAPRKTARGKAAQKKTKTRQVRVPDTSQPCGSRDVTPTRLVNEPVSPGSTNLEDVDENMEYEEELEDISHEQKQAPAHVYRWMTSLFEIGCIYLPRPVGHNLVWQLLDLDTTYPLVASYAEDAAVLGAARLEHRVWIGAGIASMLSLAISSIFNFFNITGRELNSYRSRAADIPRPAEPILMRLFTVPPSSGFGSIRIFSAACAVVSQFTTCSINATCIATAGWCGNYQNIIHHGPNCLWQSEYGVRTPYIVDVASVSWGCIAFINVWGLTAPAGSFNLCQEVRWAGDPASRGLYIRNGEVQYSTSVTGRFKYEYVPYGLFLINTVRQHFGALKPWYITYLPLEPAGDNQVVELPALVDPALQPEYVGGVNFIRPGTLPTYDWVLDYVLAPAVLARHMGEGIWRALASVKDDISTRYTGVLRELH